MSALQAFKENANQFNSAKMEGKKRGASVVEYTDLTGKTKTVYWNGAAFVDRKAALHEDKYVNGKYKAKFKG